MESEGGVIRVNWGVRQRVGQRAESQFGGQSH